MPSKAARKHHYVPRFVLRPWTKDGQLSGYYWDPFNQEVRNKNLGVSAFCYELDLLSLKTSLVRSDALESEFFGRVDDLGAKVFAKLAKEGPMNLNAHERSDFVRLLLSLDARRPVNVESIKEIGARHLEDELNSDPEILEAFNHEGVDKKPSEYWNDLGRAPLSDHALLMIQKIVDNPTVGKILINAHWRIYHLGIGDGSFVLSDRPLVRIGGYDKPKTVWAIPLSPKALFVASNSLSVLKNCDNITLLQLRKRMNESSLNQVDRYVFMIDESNLPLVRKRLNTS